jgi:FkbM family methyltransferase
MDTTFLRRLWSLRERVRPARAGVIAEGPARGLRFNPGPGDARYATGAIEQPVQAALAERLRPGDTLLDVGANVGFLAVVGAALVGATGRVIAFEPVPANARQIRRNKRLNRLRQLEVVETAVGDRTGQAVLVLARHAGGAALADVERPPDACGELTVPIVRLDDWLASRPGLWPALVKIDVEGAELQVLRGLAATLVAGPGTTPPPTGRTRPALLIEVDDATADGASRKAEACAGFCAERGYHVRRLPDSCPDLEWQVIHLLATPP